MNVNKSLVEFSTEMSGYRFPKPGKSLSVCMLLLSLCGTIRLTQPLLDRFCSNFEKLITLKDYRAYGRFFGPIDYRVYRFSGKKSKFVPEVVGFIFEHPG